MKKMDLDIFKRYSCFFDPNIPDYVFFLSFVITSLLIAILLIVMKGIDVKRMVMGTLLAECIFIIFCSTVIYRETLPEPHSNFMPFWSYQAISEGVGYGSYRWIASVLSRRIMKNNNK